jgi:hypothetical protein
VDDTFGVVGVVGAILVIAGVVMFLMAWGGMDARMPSQVPPRRFALYALGAGALLLVVALLGLAMPGG